MKSSEREPVPQPHGGALIPGAGGGPQPGAGRPAKDIRLKLRGAFDERIHILEEIIDDPETRPRDRMAAMDLLAKYGIGTQQEISGPDGGPVETRAVDKDAIMVAAEELK